MEPQVIVRHKQNLQHEVEAGSFRFVVDEPQSVGGDGAGPDPYDLLLGALGACTSMTMMLYARRKQWPVDDIKVELSHRKIHARDCETCLTQDGKVDHIERQITITGNLDEEQLARLKEIASRCPVHQTLMTETVVADQFFHLPASAKVS